MKILVTSFLLIFSTCLFSQQDFYYHSGGQKTYLTILDGVHFVHFNNGLTSENFTLEGYQFWDNYYVITDSNGLASEYSNYTVSKAYLRYGDTIFENDEIVLNFKSNVTESQKNDIISENNLSLIKHEQFFSRYISLDASIVSANIYESGLVEYSHPNFFKRAKPHYIPNDPYFNKQFYIHNTGQIINDGNSGVADADMDVVEAWDITKGDSNIIIAIIDRGITSNHPDLPNTRQLRLPGGNLSGVARGSGQDDLSPQIEHGTACAGVALAEQDNGVGISGIAPHSKLMPIKFENGLTDAILANCIDFGTINNVNITSYSFAYAFDTIDAVEKAIERAENANIIQIFSASNTRNVTPYYARAL